MKDEKVEPADDLREGVFDSFEDVLAQADTEYRTVKAWGGKMARIGSLTAAQMIAFLENNEDPAKKRGNGLMLITQSLVNKEGLRLVDQSNVEGVARAMEQLKTKDAGANGRVIEAILLLNGLGRKDAKEIAKNASGEAPSDASPSAVH